QPSTTSQTHALPYIPNRRSSDLVFAAAHSNASISRARYERRLHGFVQHGCRFHPLAGTGALWVGNVQARQFLSVGHLAASQQYRSEEHTSELQSREKLVCRRLLE